MAHQLDYTFQARCNCLLSHDGISQENLAQIGSVLGALGIPFSTGEILNAVGRVGNWVGGNVTVSKDVVVFEMNAVNAKLQSGDKTLMFPTAMMSDVQMGKMFGLANTVDSRFLGSPLRFRCWGKTNHQLLDVLRNVADGTDRP